MSKQKTPSEISNNQPFSWCPPLPFIIWKSCQTLNHLDDLVSLTLVTSNMNYVVPLGDTLHVDSVVDLIMLTQSIDPASFTLKCVYEDSSDLSFFTLSIDLFYCLGVILILLYNFIHETKKVRQNCIFPLYIP